MIGRFLELSVHVAEILESVQWYERLGFRQLKVGETWSHPYAVLSDGRLHVGLHAYEFDSPALTFVLTNLAGKLPHLERQGIEFAFRKTDRDEFNEAGFIAPEAQMITLLEARTYSPPPFEDVDFSLCGRFAEYGIPVRDLESDLNDWQALGFRLAASYDAPHPRAVLSGEELVVGLHERPGLREPVLFFGVEDLSTRAARLRAQGFELRRSQALSEHESAAALRSPEGLELRLCGPASGPL